MYIFSYSLSLHSLDNKCDKGNSTLNSFNVFTIIITQAMMMMMIILYCVVCYCCVS